MSWELVRQLREACGDPIRGEWLTGAELRRALDEHRVLELHISSNFGDSEASFGFATRYGVTFEGAISPGYLVFPRTIPEPLRRSGDSGLWEEGSEVQAAFGVPDAPIEPPAPDAPLPPSALPEELVTQVIAAPDDDGPRQVLGDWLQAKGDPRGEFIAVQCELAHPERLTAKQIARLAGRQQALLEAHAPRWMAELAWDGLCGSFRRGFVEQLSLSLGVRRLGEGWRRTPLRELDVHARVVPAMLEHPVWPRIEALTVEAPELQRATLERFCGGPTRLRALTLNRLPDDDSFAPKLLGALKLHTLETVSYGLFQRGLQTLLESPLAQTLHTLRLSEPKTYGTSAALLAEAAPPHLERLRLFKDRLHDGGARMLAASPRLAHLKELDLSLNRITDDGARALLESPHLQNLEVLILSYTDVTDSLAARLIDPAVLPKLKRLELVVADKLKKSIAGLKARFGDRLKTHA